MKRKGKKSLTFYNIMDPMKSDFIIKRNKKGKSESTLIKGEGEKEKGIQNLIIHFLILSFGELSR